PGGLKQGASEREVQHERRHRHPVSHRARRSLRRRAALAAGLRRAAPPGGPADGPREAGPTLEAPALVHEAYLRLVDVEKAQPWNSRGHFFAAAAEAMCRSLIDNVRRKKRSKRGGGRK